MCVCVLEIFVLIFLNWETILRDFCVDWIIGWVICWIAFKSVFFTSQKTGFKFLLDTSSIPCHLWSFSSIFFKCNLDTSSIPGGSIEKALVSSIAPRHLLDWSSICSESESLLLDSFLDTSSSQNPLHSGASSSSDSAPLSSWFRDDDAHKAFSENFSRQGIHSERQVILSNFADTDLPSIIHSREWESLCDVLITCPFVLI